MEMKSSEDTYYTLLRDLCAGKLRKSYPHEAEEILSLFEKRGMAARNDGGYSPTEKGLKHLSMLHEEMWYRTVETSVF